MTDTPDPSTPTDPAAAAAAASSGGVATDSTNAPLPPESHVPLTAADVPLPEGFELADETMLTKFLETANGAKVDKTTASALLGLHTEFLSAAEAAATKSWEDQQAAWKTEAEALPEIGGAALPQTLAECAKLMEAYGTPELRQMFDITGAGNHPETIRFLHSIARALNERPPVPGDPAPGRQLTRAERIFGVASNG